MADNVIELVIRTIDEASTQIAGVSDKLTGLSDALGTVAKWAAAAVAAFEGFKVAADATIQAQFATAQLNAAIKGTGQEVGVTTQALDLYAGALARSSTNSTNTIKQSEALLLTFTHIHGEAFQRVLQDASDLAARMGESLPQAVEQLAKAIDSPGITGLLALRRAGVSLSEEQIQLAQTFDQLGDYAGKANVVLAEVERRTGGSAAAAANTLGGALEHLKNSFDELLASISGSTTALNAFINAAADRISTDKLTQLNVAIADTQKKIDDIKSTGGEYLFGSGDLVEQQEKLNSLLAQRNDLLDKARLAGDRSHGELAALGGGDLSAIGLPSINIASLQVQQQVSEALAGIGASDEEFTRTVQEKADATASEFVDALNRALDSGKIDHGEAANRLLDAYVPKPEALQSGMRDAISTLNATLDQQLNPQVKLINDQYRQAIGGIQDAFARMFESIPKGWEAMARSFVQAIDQMVSKLLASQLVRLLFGTTTTTGGGTSLSGGLLSGILGGFLGGGGGAVATSDFGSLIGIPGYAGGTSSAAGGLAIVGENGPELVNLPGGSSVTPAGAWGRGGAYAPTNIITISAADADRTRAELISYLDYQQKQGFQEFARTMQRNGLPRLR